MGTVQKQYNLSLIILNVECQMVGKLFFSKTAIVPVILHLNCGVDVFFCQKPEKKNTLVYKCCVVSFETTTYMIEFRS